jgi:hypothetical protein
MKVTIVTDSRGNLVSTVRGHDLSKKTGDMHATLVMGPGQKAHFVEVDDALGKLTDGMEFHAQIRKYIPKS